jgi:hypothetical protein
MTAEIASPLPQTCCPSVWLWPGQALYSGPSLNLAPHSGSVWCLAVGIDGPLTVATVDGTTREAHSVLIPPRLTHQLICHGTGLVSCYLEPTSDRADASRHKFGAFSGEIGMGHVEEERLQFTPTDDESACRWVDLAAPPSPRPIDPRIAAAATRGSRRSGDGGLVARTGGRGGVVRVTVSSPVPQRTRNEPAALSALGSARTRRHGRRRRKELDYRGGRGGLRQPVPPRRPVQDDVRAVGV